MILFFLCCLQKSIHAHSRDESNYTLRAKYKYFFLPISDLAKRSLFLEEENEEEEEEEDELEEENTSFCDFPGIFIKSNK